MAGFIYFMFFTVNDPTSIKMYDDRIQISFYAFKVLMLWVARLLREQSQLLT